MAHHEVISRSGNAFLLNIRESVLLLGSIVNAKIIGRFSPFLMSAIGH